MNVTKTYDNKKSLFKKDTKTLANYKVNMEIAKGEIVGLVGESGCGKSTLGNIVANIFTPDSGKVFLNGNSITAKGDMKPFRSAVQMVFQDPDSSLNPVKPIGWILKEALRLKKNKPTAEFLESKMKQVGLDKELLTRYSRQLSGGQKQRVVLLLALLLEPQLIVADEAVSALDVSVQAQILNVMKQITKEEKMSLLFISHDLQVVYYLCDRIYVMYRGEIVEEGTAEDIYTRSAHPYTQSLFDVKAETEICEVSPAGCPYYAQCNRRTEHCKSNKPLLVEVQEGHKAACHYP